MGRAIYANNQRMYKGRGGKKMETQNFFPCCWNKDMRCPVGTLPWVSVFSVGKDMIFHHQQKSGNILVYGPFKKKF